MKYSQAILVACIGASALVSAAPTANRRDVTPAAPATDAVDATTTGTDTNAAAPVPKKKHHHHPKKEGSQGKRELYDYLFERDATTRDATTATDADATTTGTDANAAVPPVPKKKHHHHPKKESSQGKRELYDHLFERDATTATDADATTTGTDANAAVPPVPKKKHHHHPKKESSQGKREFYDEYELEARDFEDQLYARSKLSALKSLLHHTPSVSVPVDDSVPSTTRDFYDDLDARDFYDYELDARDFSDYELDARDFDDYELDARDFEEFDLYGRDFEIDELD
ncbi:hypothetical protein C0991_009586 [Blastosporella zonata]|nr:hypothetical protein C0991_009586 [Blastosporella zonata]